ncbi:uncharacterized protein BDV14DRAFT_206964 [Aspergillus stella-maris]|uniref:uncharacterized protein n=1 Tax=Aspergillus stella-maris TaxID=1810926 RepID=UPI003CCD8A65
MGVEKVILIYESVLVVACLALSLHAYPDTCRTILWQCGGTEGWNSDPHDRIYFYANYREPPPVPKIWSEETIESHLAISATSTMAWLIRIVLVRYQISGIRWITTMFTMLLMAFWAISIHAQISGDLSDPEHASAWPWYLVHACGGLDYPEWRCCMLARLFLAASGNLLALYVGIFVWCVQGFFRAEHEKREEDVKLSTLAFVIDASR